MREKVKFCPLLEDYFLSLYEDMDRILRSLTKDRHYRRNMKNSSYEATIAFAKAVKSYNVCDEGNFNGWLYFYIKKEIELDDNRNRKQKGGLANHASTEPLNYSQIEDEYSGISMLMLSSEDSDEFDEIDYLKRITRNLTEEEICVAIMVAQGFQTVEIANYWGCKRRDIWYIHKKALAKAKRDAEFLESRL